MTPQLDRVRLLLQHPNSDRIRRGLGEYVPFGREDCNLFMSRSVFRNLDQYEHFLKHCVSNLHYPTNLLTMFLFADIGSGANVFVLAELKDR